MSGPKKRTGGSPSLLAEHATDGAQELQCACHSWPNSLGGSADRQFQLKDGTSARCRLHPDAPAVHLHDLFGDGEAKAGAALRLSVRAVDLMELLEDTILLIPRYTGAGVCH